MCQRKQQTFHAQERKEIYNRSNWPVNPLITVTLVHKIAMNPFTRLNPFVCGTLSRQVKGCKDDSGSQNRTVYKQKKRRKEKEKNVANRQLERERVREDNGNSHACLWKSLTHAQHVAKRLREYNSYMNYVLTLSPSLTQQTQTHTF